MNNHKLVILVLCLIIILLSVPACTSKGDSKLASNLKRLIAAERQGEAEEFAQSHGIELINSSVKITIECESNQAEGVAKEVIKTGAIEVRVWKDWVSAFVPINKLDNITRIEGVRLVRLPWKMVPQ